MAPFRFLFVYRFALGRFRKALHWMHAEKVCNWIHSGSVILILYVHTSSIYKYKYFFWIFSLCHLYNTVFNLNINQHRHHYHLDRLQIIHFLINHMHLQQSRTIMHRSIIVGHFLSSTHTREVCIACRAHRGQGCISIIQKSLCSHPTTPYVCVFEWWPFGGRAGDKHAKGRDQSPSHWPECAFFGRKMYVQFILDLNWINWHHSFLLYDS